jgi:hypothetical protein
MPERAFATEVLIVVQRPIAATLTSAALLAAAIPAARAPRPAAGRRRVPAVPV